MSTNAGQSKQGAPSRREIALAEEISVAARDLADARDLGETYAARVRLNNAIRDLECWMVAGRGEGSEAVTAANESTVSGASSAKGGASVALAAVRG